MGCKELVRVSFLLYVYNPVFILFNTGNKLHFLITLFAHYIKNQHEHNS